MRHLMVWAKANPITVVSALVALAAVGGLAWVHLSGAAFTESLEAREQPIRNITSLINSRVEIPPEDPDAPPRIWSGVVTQPLINEISRAYAKMDQEYDGVFSLAVQVNRGVGQFGVGGLGHVPMLEGLFPDYGNAAAKPYDAKTAYRLAFARMTGTPDAEAHYPRLNAGRPPTDEQLESALERIERATLAGSLRARAVSDLTPREVESLRSKLYKRLMELLENRAKQLHVYAATPDPETPDVLPDDTPFDVGEWSRPGTGGRPSLVEMWEGQMRLWIQQDIVEAIARANRVGDPGASVLTSPVKRLLEIRVVPGYIGITTRGPLAITRNRTGREQPVFGGRARQDYVLMPDPEKDRTATFGAEEAPDGMPPGMRGPGRDDQRDRYQPPDLGDPDRKLPADFSVSPTGRKSNALYDVRHVRVSLVADSQRLPELFERLARVNFMTVLNMQVTDVDEYQALREGYVYGTGDAVQVDMLIETIWLRQWTQELMPEPVRLALGVDQPEQGQAN